MTRTSAPSPNTKKYISVPLTEEAKIRVPVYPTTQLGLLQCSAYVRLAAGELFGKTFSISHAWNRRYSDRVVAELESFQDLKPLIEKGVLERGMVLGIYNPLSSFNNNLDFKGNPIQYTHNALYLGRNLAGQPLMAEQFNHLTVVRTESEMRRFGLKPVHIFDSK